MAKIKKLFQSTPTEIVKKQIIEIKEHKIQMPKDDELIIFKFPKETPKEAIKLFEARLIEFQNSKRKFIIVGGEFEITKTKKENIKTEGKDEKESSTS